MSHKRRNHYDVTDQVRISHPGDVEKAVTTLLADLYPGEDLRPVRHAFDTFTRLYAGTLPGYVGCDTWYHDVQHSLDCALAMARLLDGYERSVPLAEQLGARRGLLGVMIALFHDAGYIRRAGEPALNGAEYTLNHVRRSGEFLAQFLPQIGFASQVALTRQVVHYTGYEIALDKIAVRGHKDRMLGFMLGTADILAQTADRCYLEKCRDYLYREFEICGLAGRDAKGAVAPRYSTVDDLLSDTPDFNRHLWQDRLDGYFVGVHHFMERHFGGRNPYVEQIREHLALIKRLGKKKQWHKLSKRPQVVDATVLRRMLGLQPMPKKALAHARSAAYAHAA